MTLDETLNGLKSRAQPGRDAQMSALHKVDRQYLGVANPDINDLVKSWRKILSVQQRVTLAQDLWQTNIFEARLAAAKLLNQARLRPDDEAWELICSWLPDFDSWAIADHAATAGQKRLVAVPSRLDAVQEWTVATDIWTRRAALVFTLPWAKQNNPKPADLVARDRILGWAAGYVDDPNWSIQKAVAWWLRDLSKHDQPRVVAFLERYGDRLKPFARKEAAQHLPAP